MPQKHLCKTIRKKIIHGILEKYNLVEPKVDSGRKRRKRVTKKELDAWKYKRAQGLEGWKKKKKKVISSKKKKFQKYQSCTTCGDYHFKKVCTGSNDLKVNLLGKNSCSLNFAAKCPVDEKSRENSNMYFFSETNQPKS